MQIVKHLVEQFGLAHPQTPTHLLFDRAVLEQRLAPRLIRELAPDDQMYDGDLAQYWDVAYSALRFINLALLAANQPAPRTILDFPCGHGRVLRVLQAAFPQARLTAGDLNRHAVDFCARTFGATPVYAHESPEQIQLTQKFDLIFCGSLLTHLKAERWPGFLSFFRTLLEPNGILVFTTHGEMSINWITNGKETYGLKPEQLTQLLTDYRNTGFGYQDYPVMSAYGISISAVPWVLAATGKLPDLHLVSCLPQAWLNYQDVYAYTLTPDSKSSK